MVFAERLECYDCKKEFGPGAVLFECTKCKGPLHFHYDVKKIKKLIASNDFRKAEVHHWKYWMFYPITDLSSIVTMHEGGTPLIKSSKRKGYYFKFEGVNPTGSFKDRGSSIEVTKARQLGVKELVCASTGNMGASVAAYSARAGVKATIYAPSFAPLEKLAQIKAHGANVVSVKGSYDEAFQEVRRLWLEEKAYLAGDYVYRAEGSKSVGMEIVDQLSWSAPEYVVCPIGMGNLVSGVFKGLNEFKKAGLLERLPKIIGVQAEGCAPIAGAAAKGSGEIARVKNPETIAEAINCGNPNYWRAALDAMRKTKGTGVVVSDAEIMNARSELGREGIYAEPAGAAALAGALKLGLKESVACVVTGHGLKDSFPGKS